MHTRKLTRIGAIATAMTWTTLAAVAQEDWPTQRVGGAFVFQTPPGTMRAPTTGIAYGSSGEFVNPQFTIGFDYGPFSNDLAELRSDVNYMTENVKVDSRAAVLVTGPGLGDSTFGCSGYLVAMYVVVSHNWWNGRTTRLQMHGCTSDPSIVATLRRSLQSVRLVR
jgi:hypothetical protein